jgi:hypothetical protein
MQEARAREQREYEPVSSRRRFVALDGGAAEESLATQPAGRTRPRRPTGAAAQYARGMTDGSRRTIQIGGHGAQTHLRPTPSELRGPRPDRVAGWAVGFGIFVAILAIVTGGA